MNFSLKFAPVLRLLFWVGVVFYVFSRFIPCVPVNDYPMTDGVDNAWTLALHVAFARHLQFGTEFVFTYGPWGFLARGYLPQTYMISVGAWTILSVIYLCAGWRLAYHFSKHWLASGLWLMAFTAVASIPVGEDFNTRLVAWCILLLLLHFFVEERATSPLQALLVISLGWLSLVKFTGLIESLMVVFIIAADNIFRQKRFPWLMLLWLAGVLFFWVAAGQQLSCLAPFVNHSWQITGGYTEAMMLGGKTEGGRVVCFLLIAVLSCVLAGGIAWTRHRLWGALPLAGIGAILFMVFKLGYVRNDQGHETAAVMALVLIALACLALTGSGTKRMVGAAVSLLVVAMLFAASVFSLWLPNNGLGKQIASTFSVYNLVAPVAAGSSGYLKSEYDKSMAGEQKKLTRPPAKGNADLYSYDQTLLFAQALPYEPRPVIQSYSAYTPMLAEMNADYLRTAQAADNILFAIQTIDGRFPTLDDGRSWPELLTRYDIKGVANTGGTFLTLSRAAVPRKFHLTLMGNTSAHFGEPIPVPSITNGLVWVEIDINKTAAGNMASLFYKPPTLTLTVSLHDHTQRGYRLVPGMAGSGFLLSPLVTDVNTFATLATGGSEAVDAKWDVESMTISADTESGSTADYKSAMPARFYRLELETGTSPR